MKFKRILALVFVTPLLMGAGVSDKRGLVVLGTALSKVTGEKNVGIYIDVIPVKADTYTIVSKMYDNVTNALIYTHTFSEYVYLEGTTYRISYPIKYQLTGNGLRFEYDISYRSTSFSCSGVLYPFNKQVVNVFQHRDGIYQIHNRYLKLQTKAVIDVESYDFRNLNEYLSKNVNNSIDFSSIKFQFLHDYDFSYTKAVYRIKDYKGVYPYLRKVDDEVEIAISCIKNGYNISVDVVEDLYVNPETLDMSNYQAPGYVPTDELYIPLGKQELLQQNDSYILIEEAGYSAIDLMIPFTYYFNKKMIGLCYESDYCIEGGIKE